MYETFMYTILDLGDSHVYVNQIRLVNVQLFILELHLKYTSCEMPIFTEILA